MSLVHEKLYQAKDLSHINLKEYIVDLVKYLMRGYSIRTDKVILNMELEEVFVLIDSAIPLGLVLNEMISNVGKINALKKQIKVIIIINVDKSRHTV